MKKFLNFRVPPGTFGVTKEVLVGPFENHCTIITVTTWPPSVVGIFQILLSCNDDDDITRSLDLGYVFKSRIETIFTKHSTEDLDSQ